MTRVYLAPLCGVTNHIYRTLCFEQGCDTAFTEMISAMGYLCAPEQRTTKSLMTRGTNEKKLIIQLFGKDPNTVANAAYKISRIGIYDGININMGCPARKVACSGEGSGLLRFPAIAEEMLKKTVEASTIPVSVKMRIGWDRDSINAVKIARIAENAGVCEIIVHGRTREQQYSGTADWEIIEEIKRKVNVPVIGNGDIFTSEDAMERICSTSVDGIMIGRGALGNPWIFRDIKNALQGKKKEPVSVSERYAMIRRHYTMMLDIYPEKIAVREMRKQIGWYLHGMRGAAVIRNSINACMTAEKVISILDDFFGSCTISV